MSLRHLENLNVEPIIEPQQPLYPIVVETLADDTPNSSNPSSPTSEQLIPTIGPLYK
jgi:hypothetical protein